MTPFKTLIFQKVFVNWKTGLLKNTLFRKTSRLEKLPVWKNTLFGKTPCLEGHPVWKSHSKFGVKLHVSYFTTN